MILKDAGKVIDYAFDAQSFIDTHAKRITDHYLHAREKHPYFCDELIPHDFTAEESDGRLRVTRYDMKRKVAYGCLASVDVLDCETEEMENAITHGDTAHAIEECYDAIAVLLRTIDVLEGRQKLGKPEDAAKGTDI